MRTKEFLYVERLPNTQYGFTDELYDLIRDPDERNNVLADPAYADHLKNARAKLQAFFSEYSEPAWNLWEGGSAKGNSTRPFL